MNTKILEVKDKILNGKAFTKEDVKACQNSIQSEEELFITYWIMARYYLNHNELDALTYCVLKCYELNERNHFDVDYKIKDFIEARCDFMEEAIIQTRKKILPLSILFGVITLVLVWLIMAKGEFTGFIIGFICMNLVSVNFQTIANKKTIEAFKKKQYAAVYSFLDENDQKFAVIQN